MKICIYGAGAVGGNFATRLAMAGEDVCAIARGPHLEAIQQNGLKLIVGDETFQVHLQASHDPTEVGIQDVVIVTVKGPSLTGIVDDIKALIGDETTIIFAMNGIPWWYFYGVDEPVNERRIEVLDPGSRWWNEIGPERAVGGVVYSANMIVEPGVVRNISIKSNLLRIGEPDKSISERCKRINLALDRAGLAVPVAEDIRKEIWSKLLSNIAFAPVCTLTSSPLSEVLSDPELKSLCVKIMEEVIAIADSSGIKIDIDIEDRIASAKNIGAHKPSMLQDLEHQRPMEIHSILSVPQEFGKMNGLLTPNIDTMIALLKHRASSAGLFSK